MKTLAIIGGTGLTQFDDLDVVQVHHQFDTELGQPSGDIIEARLGQRRLLFLPRHDHPHRLAPHLINYRANLLALNMLGADEIIAVNAVGGIHPSMPAGHISIPQQIIDYTWGRQQTFFDGRYKPLNHIDFTFPYDEALRLKLIKLVASLNLAKGFSDFSVYGASQGPRLETSAEIDRLEKDGCDLVGMTGMPEAALARELAIPYVSLCLVVNPAAGRSEGLITLDEIQRVLNSGMVEVKRIITAFAALP